MRVYLCEGYALTIIRVSLLFHIQQYTMVNDSSLISSIVYGWLVGICFSPLIMWLLICLIFVRVMIFLSFTHCKNPQLWSLPFVVYLKVYTWTRYSFHFFVNDLKHFTLIDSSADLDSFPSFTITWFIITIINNNHHLNHL